MYAKDNYGGLPLHFAAINKYNADVVNLLLDYYPDSIKVKAFDGSLPLHTAADSNPNTDITELLLDRYPEALTVEVNGHSVLDLAKLSKSSNKASIISLIEKELKILKSPILRKIKLNKYLQITVKWCTTELATNGLTDKVLTIPSKNDLTKIEFAFRCLDEFQKCGWEPFAEQLVKYNGVPIGGEKKKISKCCYPLCKKTYVKSESKVCTRCMIVKYCCRECQVVDSKVHKKECKKK